MSVVAIAAPTRPGRPGLRDLAVRGVAWALVACCLLLLATILLVGERPGSYADLRTAVADGRVDEVRVEGGLPDGVIGASGASVHWRDGLVRRTAPVTETSSRGQARLVGRDGPVVVGKVDESLRALDPGLRTSRAERDLRSDFGSWKVPRWFNTLAIVTVLGSLALLIAGPQPRLATRWAWFWLSWVAVPVGTLAFLLLGGSARSGSSNEDTRRITGGWAFLLAALLKLALAAVAVAVV